MNDLIKELMKQAGTDSSGKWMGVEHAEKFAELIVRECCLVIRNDGSAFNNMRYTRVEIANMIKEHFRS